MPSKLKLASFYFFNVFIDFRKEGRKGEKNINDARVIDQLSPARLTREMESTTWAAYVLMGNRSVTSWRRAGSAAEPRAGLTRALKATPKAAGPRPRSRGVALR